jgi:hypothetical protein
MSKPLRIIITLFFTLSLVTACSGSGGGGSNQTAGTGGGGGGIGGTGATARGSIDGFGSIFVNGIEFETDSATITIDGQPANQTLLGLGMVVTVEGEINPDGITGTATRVTFDDDIQGPVVGLTLSTDGNQLSFTVMGITVIADKTATVFANTSFTTLTNNDLVEISGLFTGLGDVIASRIERKGNFTVGVSEIEVKGIISSASGNSFTLGSFTVDASAADLSDLDGGVLTNGLEVDVKGTLTGSTITASRVGSEDDLIANTNNTATEVSVEGVVANFNSLADFEIAGVPVDASGATFEPTSLAASLGDNITIDVEGIIVNGVLIATEIKAEEGNIEAESTVTAVDSVNRTITVSYVNGTVTFSITNQTRLDDDTGVEEILTLDEINVGDFLEIRAYQGNSSELLATEIKRDDTDDQHLQGPVDTTDPNVSVTILGVRFDTDGTTDFEDENENSITATQFYSTVAVGDLIKIRDRETADGTADEVELEN